MRLASGAVDGLYPECAFIVIIRGKKDLITLLDDVEKILALHVCNTTKKHSTRLEALVIYISREYFINEQLLVTKEYLPPGLVQ